MRESVTRGRISWEKYSPSVASFLPILSHRDREKLLHIEHHMSLYRVHKHFPYIYHERVLEISTAQLLLTDTQTAHALAARTRM